MLQFQSTNAQEHTQPIPQSQQAGMQTLRLRDEPPAINAAPTTTRSRKRKSPTSSSPLDQQQQPPSQQPPQHMLPPPHALQMAPLPPGFYQPADYSTGNAMPSQQQPIDGQGQGQPQEGNSTPSGSARTLSNSKRAEQNRKAQRAFRERRDQ